MVCSRRAGLARQEHLAPTMRCPGGLDRDGLCRGGL